MGLFYTQEFKVYPLVKLLAVCQYVVMVCIYCGSKTKVINSRLQKRSNQIWRRRQCLKCQAVFTSNESADLTQLISIRKTHKHLEPFSREILFLSVHDALKHRKTAISDAMGLTDTIINKVCAATQAAVIDQGDLVETAGAILKRFDKAAATHYLAYHPLAVNE